jgi:hypothetical protein
MATKRAVTIMAAAIGVVGLWQVVPAVAAPAPGHDQVTPSLAYNPDLQQFLALWVEDRGSGSDIYAKKLFPNGLPQGGATRAGTAIVRDDAGATRGRRSDPALVYNTDLDEFYLVWAEERSIEDGQDVYGSRVSSAGFARSSPRRLAGGPGDQSHPSVAYNAGSQAYLVAWQDNTRDVDQVWGVRIRGNGIPFGAPLALVEGPSNAQDPSVARNGDGYLVAWVDDGSGNSDIYARRLNTNALPVGGQAGLIYPMAAGPEDELAPSLNPNSGQLVYNVYDPLTGLDIMGVRVYDTGTTGGQRPVGIAVPAADQAAPVTDTGTENIVLYSDNRSGEFDLYAVRLQNNRPKGRDFAVVQDGYIP